MIAFDALPPYVVAAIPIGLVFIEAVVLYVGYGALEQLIGPRLVKSLTREH